MTKHSKDKPLENKVQDDGKPTSPNPLFQEEDEDVSDFDRTINLGSPVFPEPPNPNYDATFQSDNMESLFEEESAEPASGTGKEDMHTVSEQGKPADEADTLGISTGELEGLKDFMDDDTEEEPAVILADMPDDENNAFTTPVKKIELTEADYADTETISSATPQTAEERAGDMPGDINEPENAIDSQVIIAAANEAHALQDKPEMTAEDETPEALSAKEPATPPAAQSRTGPATALGLIGIIAAAGALWMIFGMSNRMDQLESQFATMQQHAAVSGPGKDIALLNQRVDELGTQLAAHLKTIARTKEVTPVPDVKKPSAPAPVATKPVVTAIKPAADSGHDLWVVNLTSLSHDTAANSEVARLKGLGIRAESIKVMTQGKTWYRIRVPGFSSAEEADRQRKILSKRLGIRDTWIGKR